MQVQWKRNEFFTFYSYMKIRIGGKDLPVDAIHEGDTFEFDGTMLKYAGAEFPQPALRGAVKQDWVGVSENRSHVISGPVQTRKVAKSQTVNKDLSRVQRSDTTDSMETDSLDEETVLQVSDRGKIENKQKPRVVTARDNHRGVHLSVEDAQDGEVVGRVRSPAKLKADVLDPRNRSLASQIENRGLGKPDLIEREGVSIKTNVGQMNSGAVEADEGEGTIVGSVRHSEKVSTGGIDVQDTSGNSKPQPKPTKVTKKVKMSPKLRIAMKVYPDFPADWNFYATMDEKVARIKSESKNSDFLDALYASESASVKKVLISSFPGRFS